MNILQAISILPVCLGVALPLNSNDQANTQSNLPVYETNIQYLYETNDVNSLDDIVEGNIYLLHFEHEYSQESYEWPIWEDVGVNNILYNVIFSSNINAINFYIDYNNTPFNGNIFPFEFDFFDITLVYEEQDTSFHLNCDDESDINSFNIQINSFYNYTNSMDFIVVVNYTSFSSSIDWSFSRCPVEYIPYILVEPSASDNLYVNLYNFYYDLFKNDGIDSITFEIGSQNISLSSWIAHSLTIISLILFVVITILFVIWLFKFLSGFILLRQS